MTFIASVVAKKGVAIIADSLVTSSRQVIELEDFAKYIEQKEEQSQGGNQIALDAQEIANLFKLKPSFTKDYEEKLFEYDNFTAITTAGAAVLNGKRIEAVISEIKAVNEVDVAYIDLPIEEKVENFVSLIDARVKQHLVTFKSIGSLVFIITHYIVSSNETVIFRVEVPGLTENDIRGAEILVNFSKYASFYKVVCEGQNRTTDKVLFGDLLTAYYLVPAIAKKILKDFNIEDKDMPEGYIDSLLQDGSIITEAMQEEMKLAKLNELSLQQAVELAALLMHIEMDLQKYTEKIPSVGGVIKLAVIDRKGFRFVSGDEITKPNNL
ncbi:hypothetical protein [Adhaeribacter rhizoryzae]|uniref:Uncharacterized protein n=1 Tax=Adhaeribacter rhizoryzae TaxID=2607907 RepID=A0A5M6D784_9BACT|nr:hypothetical protein [Adhaeribacter rhizoryzae]KAA5543357.1 hypothetical protein F0145_17090 [Adhaeribacter rhizoryzae]